jgi:hypothetical protein
MLEDAARALSLNGDHRPIVIADYGSSEGRNSAVMIRAALTVLRERFGKRRPVIVFHTDLPANDFSTLFRTVEAETGGYAHDDDAVFPAAIGRSFYRSVLADSQVDLGWSSYAVQWLSRTPSLVAGHIFPERGNKTEREAFAAQARSDWESFLLLRARELRAGGYLVMALPAGDAEGSHPMLPLFDAAARVIVGMEGDGLLSASERAGMVIPVGVRSYEQLLEPFDTAVLRSRWRALQISIKPMGDAAHEQFLRDGNVEALASRRAAFFRATFGPALAFALASNRTEEDRKRFLEELERRLRDGIVSLQQPIAYRVGVLSLERL